MDSIEANWKFNQFFQNTFFGRERHTFTDTENAFHDLVIRCMNNRKFQKTVIDPDTEEVDLNWLSFLWWVYVGDSARINDFLHGFFWPVSGDNAKSHAIDENSRFFKLLDCDPIVKAERAKTKDYIKHINWIFHKTQNLPLITVIGRWNVPARLHGLRQAKITVIDPVEEPPIKHMFDDFGQRSRYRTLSSYDIYDVTNTKDYKMIGTQNVVIIEDSNISLDETQLKERILRAASYLTTHGRCLFDIPMYDLSEVRSNSELYRLIRPFIPESNHSGIISLQNASAIDTYVHGIVDDINQSEYLKNGGYKFEIEELKLTDADLSRSIAARVYLKLSPTK